MSDVSPADWIASEADGRETVPFPGQGDRWLDAPEVAKIVGCSVSRVYGLVSEGRLPSIRFGRRVKVPYSALTTLAQQSLMHVDVLPTARPQGEKTHLQPPQRRRESRAPKAGAGQRPDRQESAGAFARTRADGSVVVQRNKERGNGTGTVFWSNHKHCWVVRVRLIGRERASERHFDDEKAAWAWLDAKLHERDQDFLRVEGAPIQLTDRIEDLLGYASRELYPEPASQYKIAAAISLFKAAVPEDDERRLGLFVGGGAEAEAGLFNLKAKLNRAIRNGRACGAVNNAIAILHGACKRYLAKDDIWHVFSEASDPFKALHAFEDPIRKAKDALRVREDDYSDLDGAEAESDPRLYGPDELKDVLRLLACSWVFVGVVIQIFADLRPGELCGLVVGNYDRDRGLLHIRRAIKADGRRGDLKTGALGWKDCYLPEPVCRVLEWWLAKRELEKGAPLEDRDPIFVAGGWTGVANTRLTPRKWGQILQHRTSGTPMKFIAYACRHAGATLARLADFNEDELAIFMGHTYRDQLPMNRRYGRQRMPLDDLAKMRMEEIKPELQAMCAKLEATADQLIGWWDPSAIVRDCACGGCDACNGEGQRCARELPLKVKALTKYCTECQAVRQRASRKHRSRLRARPCQCTGCSAHEKGQCGGQIIERRAAKLCDRCRSAAHSASRRAAYAREQSRRTRELAQLEARLTQGHDR